jgi:hypothetical protein
MTCYRLRLFHNNFLNRVRDQAHVIVEMKYEKPFEL